MKYDVIAYCWNDALAGFTQEDARRLTHVNLAFGLIKDGLLDLHLLAPLLDGCQCSLRFRQPAPRLCQLLLYRLYLFQCLFAGSFQFFDLTASSQQIAAVLECTTGHGTTRI